MPNKMALLDFTKCRPEDCPDGTCQAALACPSKLLVQEAPYTIPLPEPFACRACGDCVRACPDQAIRIVNG